MSSGFITESEIAEARRKRQEEWEKVRNAEDPKEAPEETYDPRSLYERLQEQKQKKDLEYEEAHKLKNMIKGLDDDEIEFMDLVDRTKLAVEKKKSQDEERELNDYRNRVASLNEKSLGERLQAEIMVAPKPKTTTTTRNSQVKLLKGAVVTKTEPKKRKRSNSDSEESKETGKSTTNDLTMDKENCDNGSHGQKRKFDEVEEVPGAHVHKQGALTCIGILPGLGYYNDTSESDVSSDSEPEYPKLDMLGRKIKKQEKSE